MYLKPEGHGWAKSILAAVYCSALPEKNRTRERAPSNSIQAKLDPISTTDAHLKQLCCTNDSPTLVYQLQIYYR